MSKGLIGPLLVTAMLLLPAVPAEPEEPAEDGTHTEVASLGGTPELSFGQLSNLCMAPNGDLLACDAKSQEVKVLSQQGKLIATWKLEFAPYAIHACKDGTVYVAGEGALAKLDRKGKVLKALDGEGVEYLKGRASGLTASEKDVFVALGSAGTLKSVSVLVRFDRELNEAKPIASGLRGCCRRLDLLAHDGTLHVAENAKHRVVQYDRDGKILSKWGKRSRTDIDGFGSCCNPMNLCLGSDGVLYTAESGLGRIKRYSLDGKYLGLVGYVGTDRFSKAGKFAISCSSIALAVSGDGSRVFVQDFKNGIIRVLEERQ